MSAEPRTAYYDRLPGSFAQTEWTTVITPSGEGNLLKLDLLCRAYWYPLYWFARRKGTNEPDAQDQVQDFFADLISKRKLRKADRERCRFRTFLLTAFARFRIDQWRKTRNRPVPASLEEVVAEYGDAAMPSVEDPGDADFSHDWAVTLLNLALQRLAEDQQSLGRGERFDSLKGHLDGGKDLGELARNLGIPVGTLKSDLHRLRKRMKQLFFEEVKRTLKDPTPDELEQEIRFVLRHAAGGQS